MKKRIVYKLFAVHCSKLFSWCPPFGCQQEYFKKIVNTPKLPGSLIFVFDSIKHAKEHAGKSAHSRTIYKCEATGVQDLPYRHSAMSRKDDVQNFWNGSEYRNHCYFVTPAGTLGCKTLKLVKRVSFKKGL